MINTILGKQSLWNFEKTFFPKLLKRISFFFLFLQKKNKNPRTIRAVSIMCSLEFHWWRTSICRASKLFVFDVFLSSIVYAVYLQLTESKHTRAWIVNTGKLDAKSISMSNKINKNITIASRRARRWERSSGFSVLSVSPLYTDDDRKRF